jgi:hypothetical protein
MHAVTVTPRRAVVVFVYRIRILRPGPPWLRPLIGRVGCRPSVIVLEVPGLWSSCGVMKLFVCRCVVHQQQLPHSSRKSRR